MSPDENIRELERGVEDLETTLMSKATLERHDKIKQML